MGGKHRRLALRRTHLPIRGLKKNRKDGYEIGLRRTRGPARFVRFAYSTRHSLIQRLVDFERRISGASYEEIAGAGGGIAPVLTRGTEGRKTGADSVTRESSLSAWSVERDIGRNRARPATVTRPNRAIRSQPRHRKLKSLEAIRAARASGRGAWVRLFLGAPRGPPEYRGCFGICDLGWQCHDAGGCEAQTRRRALVTSSCDRGAFKRRPKPP